MALSEVTPNCDPLCSLEVSELLFKIDLFEYSVGCMTRPYFAIDADMLTRFPAGKFDDRPDRGGRNSNRPRTENSFQLGGKV